MAGYDDGHVPRQRVQPIFKLADPGEIEVVGRLVEQQHVGLGHQHAGEHGKPLPAAAQLSQRLLPQRLGHLKGFQRHIDPPVFAVPLVGGERLEHGRVEAQVHQSFRHVLLDIANRQPTGSRDFAFARFHLACHATQQGGFSATVGGDKPDPVAGIDDEVQTGKTAARSALRRDCGY